MSKLYKLLDKKFVKDEQVFNELVRKNRNAMNRINWNSILSYYYENRIIEWVNSSLTYFVWQKKIFFDMHKRLDDPNFAKNKSTFVKI